MSKRAPAGDGGLFDAPPDPARSAAPHYRQHRQRVRQRFLSGEAEAFADYELLELVLFYSVDRVDVKPLAKALLDEFGSLGAVLAASPVRLTRHKRVSERTLVHFKAMREMSRRLVKCEVVQRPVISSWQQLLDYCRVSLADEPAERFRVLYLDRKNALLADELQQRGTVDQTPVYPREVMKRALELGASALIMVHNHPSGDPTPSHADIAMTREVREAGEKLGIALHDHVIVARSGTRSLRSLGVL